MTALGSLVFRLKHTASRRRLWPQLDARGWQNATLLALLLTLQFAGIVFAPLGMVGVDSLQRLAALAAVGSGLAPPTLLALWAVLGPGRFTMRLPVTTWLAAAAYVTMLFMAIQLRGIHGDAAGISITMTCPLLAFAYAQLPLWIIRALRRWRFVSAAGVEANTQAAAGHLKTRENQFTLRGLLAWTLAVAVLLAAFRAMVPAASFSAETTAGALPFVVFGGFVVALAGLPIVALAWIFLAAGRRPLLRLVLSLLLLTGLPGGLWLFINQTNRQALAEIIPVLAGTIANGIVSLIAVGACGYRLDRPRRQSDGFSESVPLRRPLSRARFALALAPLLSLVAAILCAVPFQLRHWRRTATAAEWAQRGVFVSFDETGGMLQVHGVTAEVMSDELLRRIAELKDLEFLSLAGTKIDDRQLALLAPLTHLRNLELSDCEITDRGLDELARFKKLEVLDLTNTRVTDAGLTTLKALPRLRALTLQLTDVTDDGMGVLAELRGLDWLDVALTAVTDAGARQFKRPVHVLSYGASDALLAEGLTTHRRAPPVIGGAPRGFMTQPRRLKRLHAQGAHSSRGTGITVTDAGLSSLAPHTDLEELDLHNTAITDRGLRLLAKLTSLKTLDVRGTKVTEQGVAALARSLRGCTITR